VRAHTNPPVVVLPIRHLLSPLSVLPAPAPTELYTLSLHDALPISVRPSPGQALLPLRARIARPGSAALPEKWPRPAGIALCLGLALRPGLETKSHAPLVLSGRSLIFMSRREHVHQPHRGI